MRNKTADIAGFKIKFCNAGLLFGLFNEIFVHHEYHFTAYIDRTVDFLKMDVEGAEMEIMEDLRREDKLKHIRQMAIEYHRHIVSNSDELSKMLRLLEDSGFRYQLESNKQSETSFQTRSISRHSNLRLSALNKFYRKV